MKQINIFLGGGVALLEGDENQIGYRPSVVDPVISYLNSIGGAKHFFIVKTYANLVRKYTPEGHQEHYLRFVENEADIALFIFDGRIGDKTKKEIEHACDNSQKTKHPTIFFYGTNLDDKNEIVEYLNSKKQYFQHFNDKEHLKSLISNDLSQWEPNISIFQYMTRKYKLVTTCISCCLIVLCGLYFFNKKDFFSNFLYKDSSKCDISLCLMKYSDLNRITGKAFADSLYEIFHYETVVDSSGEIYIHPTSPILTVNSKNNISLYNSDSIPYHNPVFRLTMNGLQKGQICYKKAFLEIEEYRVNPPIYRFKQEKNGIIVKNESMIQRKYSLDYIELHKSESFTHFTNHLTNNGFADSLYIPIENNTFFKGVSDGMYVIDGSKSISINKFTSTKINIISLSINDKVNEYQIIKYNTIDGNIKNGFSRTVNEGEDDEKVYFAIDVIESCSFKIRVKLIDIQGKWSYSNFVNVQYIKPKSGYKDPLY